MADVLEAFPVLMAAPFDAWVGAATAYYSLALVRWVLVLWMVR